MRILSLTTFRELFRLSLPMVVSQGSFAVMVFTDRWFMSHLDAAHIAAAMGGGVASAFLPVPVYGPDHLLPTRWSPSISARVNWPSVPGWSPRA